MHSVLAGQIGGKQAKPVRKPTLTKNPDEQNRRKAPEGAGLDFRFYCTQPQMIMLSADKYKAEIEITASNGWQTLEIRAERLKYRGIHGPLQSWSNPISLAPKPGSDITKMVFADLKWKVPAKE